MLHRHCIRDSARDLITEGPKFKLEKEDEFPASKSQHESKLSKDIRHTSSERGKQLGPFDEIVSGLFRWNEDKNLPGRSLLYFIAIWLFFLLPRPSVPLVGMSSFAHPLNAKLIQVTQLTPPFWLRPNYILFQHKIGIRAKFASLTYFQGGNSELWDLLWSFKGTTIKHQNFHSGSTTAHQYWAIMDAEQKKGWTNRARTQPCCQTPLSYSQGLHLWKTPSLHIQEFSTDSLFVSLLSP